MVANTMDGAAVMHNPQDARAEAALYWSAISLIVCEALSLETVARRLNLDEFKLCEIVRRRHMQTPHASSAERHPAR